MSVFTNPADAARDAAAAYIKAVLQLLGDQDALTVLARTPGELKRLTGSYSPEQLRMPEAPGKWSIVEVVQHLADSELVWGFRLRLVLAQERPTLTGYDQDSWANRLRYREAKFQDALRQFQVLRSGNLELIRPLTPQELQRTGIHNERGEESVAHMLRLYAGHDLVHLNQITRIAARLGS